MAWVAALLKYWFLLSLLFFSLFPLYIPSSSLSLVSHLRLRLTHDQPTSLAAHPASVFHSLSLSVLLPLTIFFFQRLDSDVTLWLHCLRKHSSLWGSWEKGQEWGDCGGFPSSISSLSSSLHPSKKQKLPLRCLAYCRPLPLTPHSPWQHTNNYKLLLLVRSQQSEKSFSSSVVIELLLCRREKPRVPNSCVQWGGRASCYSLSFFLFSFKRCFNPPNSPGLGSYIHILIMVSIKQMKKKKSPCNHLIRRRRRRNWNNIISQDRPLQRRVLNLKTKKQRYNMFLCFLLLNLPLNGIYVFITRTTLTVNRSQNKCVVKIIKINTTSECKALQNIRNLSSWKASFNVWEVNKARNTLIIESMRKRKKGVTTLPARTVNPAL